MRDRDELDREDGRLRGAGQRGADRRHRDERVVQVVERDGGAVRRGDRGREVGLRRGAHAGVQRDRAGRTGRVVDADADHWVSAATSLNRPAVVPLPSNAAATLIPAALPR
jgi:hypothetical protein